MTMKKTIKSNSYAPCNASSEAQSRLLQRYTPSNAHSTTPFQKPRLPVSQP